MKKSEPTSRTGISDRLSAAILAIIAALLAGSLFLPLQVMAFIGVLCLMLITTANRMASDRRNQRILKEMVVANEVLVDVRGSVNTIDNVTAMFEEKIGALGDDIDEIGITANDLRPLFELLKESREKIIELINWISAIDWDEAGEKWDRAKELLDRLKKIDLEYLIGHLAKEDPDVDPYDDGGEKEWVMEQDDNGRKRFYPIPIE